MGEEGRGEVWGGQDEIHLPRASACSGRRPQGLPMGTNLLWVQVHLLSWEERERESQSWGHSPVGGATPCL